MATRRTGNKVWIWSTWLAKAIANRADTHQCLYSPWFKVRYKYDKYEEQATDLSKWNRDHTKLMKARRAELEADGWTIYEEDANSFKLEGAAAIVSGKPDLIAVKGDQVLVVDGKTGRERDSDIWQVLIYIYAIQKARPELADKRLEAEVHYRTGDVTLTPAEFTPERQQQMVSMIGILASEEPPKKVPSRAECRFCNIGVKDCPERVTRDREAVAVADF